MGRIHLSCLLLVFLILLVMPGLALAYTTDCTPEAGRTCYQASSSYSDISNAISAARAGDTVRISAGNYTFSSTIYVDKALYIIGAGSGSTTITDNSLVNGTWDLSGSGFIRLSGFTLAGSAGSYGGSIRIRSKNKRVDNLRLNQSGDRHPIGVYGNLSNVVIDHSTFESGGRGINVFGSAGYWTDEAQFAPGTNYGVYVEDSTFNKGGVEVMDITFGGAYIVRYSTINNGGNLAVHGADSGSRSGGYIEVYNNTFDNAGVKRDMNIIIRGGVAIIHNNTIIGSFNSAFKVQNWRSCFGFISLPFHSSNQNRCEHFSVNPLDGDVSPENNGWPCKDQAGRGPNQSSHPMYEWNNTWNAGAANFNISSLCAGPPNAGIHVQSGRDYFTDTTMPGYTTYTYPHPLLTASAPSPPQNLTTVP